MYQVHAYYQQNLSFPNSFMEQSFSSKQAGIAWAKAYRHCFFIEVYQQERCLLRLSRYAGRRWRWHPQREEDWPVVF